MKKVIFILLYIFVLNIAAKYVEVIEPNTKKVDRPCDFDDIKCIRKVLTKKGWCKNRITKKQPAHKPLKIDKMDAPMPCLNISDVPDNTVVAGLNKGKVVEFYLNEKTDRAVFSVKFTNIHIESTNNIYYNRKEKEPIFIKTQVYEEYTSFTTTTIVKGLNKRKPSRYTSTYMHELPEFTFSDGLQENCDADVQNLFEAIYANPGNQIAEIFVPRGPVFEDFFVNNVICSK